jgi:hypothetical protein
LRPPVKKTLMAEGRDLKLPGKSGTEGAHYEIDHEK